MKSFLHAKYFLYPFVVTLWTKFGVYSSSEQEAQKYLQELEPKYNEVCNRQVHGHWHATVNISEQARLNFAQADKELTEFKLTIQKEINTRFPNWKTFESRRLKRAFEILAVDGPGNMPVERVHKFKEIIAYMMESYSTAKVCKYKNPTDCKLGIGDLDAILRKSHDHNEMEYYFTAWHDKISQFITPEFYMELVNLNTDYAQANGFQGISDMWLKPYDEGTPTWSAAELEKTVIKLERELNPMFYTLHAYVRMKLRKLPEFQHLNISKCGYIPAHITGNMWAQEWSKLHAYTKPFPNAPAVDATNAMQKQGYTPLKMFQEGDKFYKSLGFKGLTPEFYKTSIFEKPANAQMSCHGSAYDFCEGKGGQDFRISMCTTITQRHFITVHHEIGHLEYFRQYTDLEFPFREGANPGFHEAAGDAITLSVLNPEHLQCKLGLELGLEKSLCEHQSESHKVTETDLNFLFLMALTRLPTFPFILAMDAWRWDIFEGRAKPEEFNYRWWKMRKQLQGIVPPTDRGANAKLFDAAGKFHINANYDYIRYWIAGILTYQFYEAMCIAAKQYNPNDPKSKPLYQCDFAGSREAGIKLENMMKLGSSQYWPDALEAITGSREMRVEPLKHYLQPILEYMENELKANGEIIGYGDTCDEADTKGRGPMLSIEEHWNSYKKGTLFN